MAAHTNPPGHLSPNPFVHCLIFVSLLSETRRTQATEMPSPRQQQHDNQTMDKRVGAQGGGLYGRPFGPPLFTMFLSKHGEKKGWLGGGVRTMCLNTEYTIKVTGLGTLLPALNNISVKKYFLKQSLIQ